MAAIYQRKDSRYWWINYRVRPGPNGVVQKSTHLRVGVGMDTRAARKLAAEKTVEEFQHQGCLAKESWLAWVPGYLDTRFQKPTRTLEAHRCHWRNLLAYLQEKNIPSPRGLTRTHCIDYIAWRQQPDPASGKYPCCHNTALGELKTISMLMTEAVHRGFASANPCFRLGIQKAPQREKPALTIANIDAIRKAASTWPDPGQRHFLTTSFEIAIHHGCRLRETWLPLSDIDLAAGTITFHAKGDIRFTTRLHPNLVPLVKRLHAEGRTETFPKECVRVGGSRLQDPSRLWIRLLRSIGLHQIGVSFHSTRVTVITTMARANVPEAKAQKYVHHSSTAVHRIYQRLGVHDLDECVDALQFTATPPAPSATESAHPPPPASSHSVASSPTSGFAPPTPESKKSETAAPESPPTP